MLGCFLALAASGAEDVVVEVVAGPPSHAEVSGLVEAPVDLVLESLMHRRARRSHPRRHVGPKLGLV
jgi:hypothetical protein